MDFETLAYGRRTIRKYTQKPIDMDILKKFVDMARLAPSGANLQPIKYKIVNDKETVDKIFDCVKWAAYIAPNGTPSESERPTAFIAVYGDTEIKQSGFDTDAGAAVQTILLAAEEKGIGTCWMGAIDRPRICSILGTSERYVLNTVIALGYKDEESQVVDMKDNDVKYFKDKDNVLNVPKRTLNEILL